MIEIDLYLLATQGQFSPDRNEYWTPDGFYIFIEEEIITSPGGGSYEGGSYRREPEKKKKITLHVSGDGIAFKETFIVNNINLKVIDVRYDTIENLIRVDLRDVKFDDTEKIIVIPTFKQD